MNPKEYPTVVYFHENAGSFAFLKKHNKKSFLDLGTRLDFIRLYYEYTKANILIVAYRG